MGNLTQNIEKLKKEVWYLTKYKIPSLESQISSLGGVDLDELNTALASQKASLKALDEKLTEQEGKITNIESTQTTQANSLTEISATLSQTNASLTELQTLIDGHTTSISTINTTLSSHQTSIDNNASSITSLQSQINTLSDKIDTNTEAIEELQADLTAVNTDITSIKTKNEEQDTSINTLSTKVTSLEENQETALTNSASALEIAQNVQSQLENLSGTGSSSSPANLTGTVLYDMRGTELLVHRNFKNGIKKGTPLKVPDFANYNSFKIFMQIASTYEAQFWIDINSTISQTNNRFTYVTFVGQTSMYFIRIRFPRVLNVIAIEQITRLDISSTSYGVDVSPSEQDSIFIYRIEAFK